MKEAQFIFTLDATSPEGAVFSLDAKGLGTTEGFRKRAEDRERRGRVAARRDSGRKFKVPLVLSSRNAAPLCYV